MNLKDWVVVFDLDDTLISELEYQRSGIAVVEKLISSLYGVSFDGCIQSAFNDGVEDLWGWACHELGLPMDVKSSFLWLYRLHQPEICLAPGIRSVIDILCASNASIAILSDGRSVTQRLKLMAVGLDSFPLFLSEDFQSVKPEPERFVAIENHWPGCRYVYVADNISKDFVAPDTRGWLTLGANWINPRIHESSPLSKGCCQPSYWLSSPMEVIARIEQRQVLSPN
jgi:putative hydrolase of the HAD superfamily